MASDEGGLWAIMDREETRLRRSPFLMKDAQLQSYLRSIVEKLAGEHAPDVRVYPVRTPHFNASMAPNGMMQVWSGLLLRAENEAQLAAVLGHELGHYFQRHSLERLRDIKTRSAFGMFLGMFGVVGLVGQMATIAGAYAFSRDHEREADMIGLHLMRRAGYDTREVPKIWDNLQKELEASHGGDPSKSSVLFATHPPSQERSQVLGQYTGMDSGGFVGGLEYEQQLAGVRQVLLEDEVRRGQHGQSLVLLSRLIERSPKRSDLFFHRGEVRRLRAGPDDGAAALEDFRRALELGNEPPELHRSMGLFFRSRDEQEQARQAFQRYLDRAPGAPDAGMIKTFL